MNCTAAYSHPSGANYQRNEGCKWHRTNCVAGKKEAEGPPSHGFDIKSMDTKFGEKTWELAEKKIQQLALNKLLQKARIDKQDVDVVFSGDLLNQCIGSSFTLRGTGSGAPLAPVDVTLKP